MRILIASFINTLLHLGLIAQTDGGNSDADLFEWKLSAEPKTIDAGTSLQGQVKTFTVRLKNESLTGTQVISKVETSCSCVAPKISQSILKPRQTAELTFELQSGSVKKHLNELIAIEYSNVATNDLRILKIPVTGKVESVIEVSSRRVEFDNSTLPLESQVHTLIAKVGSSDTLWSKLVVESKPKNLISAEVVKRGSIYEIRIVPKSENLKYGKNEGWIVINCLNDLDQVVFKDALPVIVDLDVPISSEPRFLYLDDLYVNEEGTVRLMIKKKDTSVKISSMDFIRAKTDDFLLSADQTKSESGLEFLVKLTPYSTGLLKTKIVLSFTSDRMGELSIPIVGVVKGSKNLQ